MADARNMSSKNASRAAKDPKEMAHKKAEAANIFTLDEYCFPHAVFLYEQGGQLREETLINGYNKLYSFLNIDDYPGKLILYALMF